MHIVVPTFALLAILALHPVGYNAGGDQYAYVVASQRIAGGVFALPATHWALRFPLVMPIGAAFSILGIGPVAASLVPLTYALACVMLLSFIVTQRFGRVAGMTAGIALALTPAFSDRGLSPAIDTVELAWLLAAVLALQTASHRNSRFLAYFGGVLFALATMSRATSFAVVLIAGLASMALPRRCWWLPIAAMLGFISALSVEALVFFWTSGNPLYGWQLSMHHTRIPSTELARSVDLSQSPLFNPAFIGGWRRPMGIHVHWTLDGLLNLVVNPEIALTLWSAGVLFLVAVQQRLSPPEAVRMIGWMLAAAGIYFAILTYGLAVNPAPRMFLPIVCIAATVLAVAGMACWCGGHRLLVATAAILLVARGVTAPFSTRDLRSVNAITLRWAQTLRRPVAITEPLARVTILQSASRTLPRPEIDSGSVITITDDNCRAVHDDLPAASTWRLIGRQAVPEPKPALISWLQSHEILLRSDRPAIVCAFIRDDRAG